MPVIAIEIVVVFLLILANGVFALAELSIVSSRRTRLQQMAEQGDRSAQVALELARDPTNLLATVQIGITLIGILAGAFGGATIAGVISASLMQFPLLAPYGDALGLAIVVVVITYFSLVLGELVPKQLALTNPERMAARIAPPMRQLARLATPLVRLLTWSTDVVLGLLRVRASSDSSITPEEIAILMKQGASAGVIEDAEHDIAESALFLGDRRISQLMVTRLDITWIDLDDSLEEIRRTVLSSRHSYFPAAREDLDKVAGMLRGRDLLAQLLDTGTVDWNALLTAPLFVPESQTVLDLLRHFKQSRQHVALVIDEFGGLQGLITDTDVLEALVGDLPYPGEVTDEGAVRREDGSWLIDGRLSVRELCDLLNIQALPDERAYDTLGGFVMAQLGEVPLPGQHFSYAGWRFEVVDMDGRRVDKVLVAPLDPAN